MKHTISDREVGDLLQHYNWSATHFQNYVDSATERYNTKGEAYPRLKRFIERNQKHVDYCKAQAEKWEKVYKTIPKKSEKRP